MADQQKQVIDGYICPHCKSLIPSRRIGLLTRRSRIRCDNCNTMLTPVIGGGNVRRLLPGILFSIGTIGAMILLAPILGVTTIVFILILIHTIGIYLSVKFFNKHISLIEADTFPRGGKRSYIIRASPFHSLETTPSQLHENNDVLEGFMCPQCKHKFPAWKAIILTRWTRYICPNCQSRLSPVLRETEIAGMISGILGCIGSIIILETMAPTFGFWQGIFGVIIYTITLLVVVTILSNKYVHLEFVDNKKYL